MDDQTEQLIYWIIIPIYGSHLQYKERQKGRNRKVQIAKDDSQQMNKVFLINDFCTQVLDFCCDSGEGVELIQKIIAEGPFSFAQKLIFQRYQMNAMDLEI